MIMRTTYTGILLNTLRASLLFLCEPPASISVFDEQIPEKSHALCCIFWNVKDVHYHFDMKIDWEFIVLELEIADVLIQNIS